MIKKNDYDLYFLNDLYNTECVNTLTGRYRNRLYNPILEGKTSLLNNYIENGPVSDLVVNISLNEKYGFPLLSTYSLQIRKDVLPFYSDKTFGLQEESYGKPISVYDVLNNDSIFSRGLYFYVNGYLINNARVVIEKDFNIIFIQTSFSGNISTTEFEQVLNSEDGQWTIMLRKKSDYLTAFTTRNLLFTNNRIYKSVLNIRKEYVLSKKSDKWTLYISTTSSSIDLMESTTVTLKTDEAGLEYFEVPAEFKDYIYEYITNAKVLLVNEVDCTGIGYYRYQETTEPKFKIPFTKNPIPTENIIVCKYDFATKRELHPIKSACNIIFPNLYDFSHIYNEGDSFDLIIKWLEITDDVSDYDSYTQDYVDYLGDDYAQMKEDGTLDPNIDNYTPIHDIAITSEDYLTSEYKGDYRAWKLDKLMTMLKDNPNRYYETFNMLFTLNGKHLSASMDAQSNVLLGRSIMSNNVHCNNANELTVGFSEPHTYVEVFNPEGKNYNYAIYIDGVKMNYTYSMVYGSTSYVYFPLRFITNAKIFHIDIELEGGSQESELFVLDNTELGYKLTNFDDPNSLSNIIICNNKNNEILGLNNFKFDVRLLEANIQYMGLTSSEVLMQTDSETILYDSLDQLIVPTDAAYIVLSASVITHTITDINFHNKISLNNIVIYPLNTDVYLTNLNLHTTNFYKDYRFYAFSDASEDGVTNKFIIENFRGKQGSTKWFHCFCNGKLINPNEVTYEFSGIYNGEVTVIISNTYEGQIDVEYCGYDEETYVTTIGELRVHDLNLLRLDKLGLTTTYHSNIHKIFIDGYRVPNQCIKNIGGYPMIYISENPFEFNENSTIVIFEQTMDESPYGYDNESMHYMMNTVETDKGYAEYLIKNYAGVTI